MDTDIYDLSKKSEAYQRISRENLKLYNTLKDGLSGEQLDDFIKFADNSCDCEAESNESYFKEGFKAGVRLAVECMCD